jgi:MarR family transcriptional regulator, organic hydroperoxide resistance regulator
MTVSSTPQAPDVRQVNTAWDAFLGALRRARARASNDPRAKLSLSQYHLIRPLDDSRELPVGELAAAAAVSPPTATRMLDGLERDGIVTREHSHSDRRCVEIQLTPQGRRLLRSERARVEAKREELFAQLSPDERVQAEHLLQRLAELIEEL